MTELELYEQVALCGGLTSEIETARVTRAVLASLAETLSWSEAEAIADELPPTVAPALHVAKHGQRLDCRELAERVAEREGVDWGFAVEHLQSVCRVLGEILSPTVRERLERTLPPTIASLFDPRQKSEPPTLSGRRGRDLATGRPGSSHPLSEARVDSAQSDSVARDDNPHADTKISSSQGMTQEREHEDLAEGKPGSERPLARKGDK